MKSALGKGGLYVITDASLTPGAKLVPAVAAAIRGGAGLVQYRDKGDPTADRARRECESRALLALCQEYGLPLIINDDIELAVRIGAAGVHLGRDDADPTLARQRLGPNAIIGISGYANPDAALTAEADYVAFGRLFDSPTKPQARPATLDVLRQARALTAKPLVGIGGISPDNAPLVKSAGADWLAVVSAVFTAVDIEAASRHLCDLIAVKI